MVKHWLILCFTLSLTYCSLALTPNSKQNFCQHNRCLTCVGRYCTTTCQGPSCKDCPLGDCCTGTNCNICRGEICCKTEECNNCINTCLKKCQGISTCHFDCFQECIPNPEFNRTSGRNSIVSSVNYLPVNVTTVINITNTIKNVHDFHSPIIVNTTNYNNYTTRNNGSRHNTYHDKKVIINENQGGVVYDYGTVVNGNGIVSKHNCCEVVHPEICQNIQGQNSFLCYTGKHKECSQLCTTKFIHVVETKEQNQTCITVARPPYFFCGKYVTEECDICYECSDEEETACSEREECSDTCKASIIAEQFYNKLYRKD